MIPESVHDKMVDELVATKKGLAEAQQAREHINGLYAASESLRQQMNDDVVKNLILFQKMRGERDNANELLQHRESQLLIFWNQLFPNYAWTDSRTAVDLMAAEITTTRGELKTANDLLRRAQDEFTGDYNAELHDANCSCLPCTLYAAISAHLNPQPMCEFGGNHLASECKKMRNLRHSVNPQPKEGQ